MSKGGSARIKDIASRRILDDASRQRRARKALERLECDNNQDDPHADLVMSKKALSLFQDEGGDNNVQERRTKRKAKTLEYYKQRFRKNFSQLLEEEVSAVMTDGEEEDGESGPVPGYLTAQVNTSIPTVSFNTFPNAIHFSKSANHVQVSDVMLHSLLTLL